MSRATENYKGSREALRELARDDDPDVAAAARITLKHRYDEEVSP